MLLKLHLFLLVLLLPKRSWQVPKCHWTICRWKLHFILWKMDIFYFLLAHPDSSHYQEIFMSFISIHKMQPWIMEHSWILKKYKGIWRIKKWEQYKGPLSWICDWQKCCLSSPVHPSCLLELLTVQQHQSCSITPLLNLMIEIWSKCRIEIKCIFQISTYTEQSNRNGKHN